MASYSDRGDLAEVFFTILENKGLEMKLVVLSLPSESGRHSSIAILRVTSQRPSRSARELYHSSKSVPEEAMDEWYNSLADLYQKKLWHQLTLKLDQFGGLSVFQKWKWVLSVKASTRTVLVEKTKSKKVNQLKTTYLEKAISSSATALFKSPSRPSKTLGSISDLKEMASLHLDNLNRHIDRSHTGILKEIDASYCQLHKRFKNSYVEFMVDVHANTSHACKSSITKLTQSVEKAIDGLRNCYGISSA